MEKRTKNLIIVLIILMAFILVTLIGILISILAFGGTDNKNARNESTIETEISTSENAVITTNEENKYNDNQSYDEGTIFITNDTTSTEVDKTEETIKNIVIIDVTGVTQEAAIKMLKNEGFKEENILIEIVKDDVAQEGYVVEQSLAKGTSVPVDAKITLKVSGGAEEVQVPDVIGLTDQQACTIINEAGFEYAHTYEYSEDVEKDYVISTTPAAYELASKGSKIVITVSNGSEKKETSVPNIYGLTKEEAITSIEGAKLEVGNVSEEHHDTIPAGQVISQSPAANSNVEEGESVDFVVSKGKKQE